MDRAQDVGHAGQSVVAVAGLHGAVDELLEGRQRAGVDAVALSGDEDVLDARGRRRQRRSVSGELIDSICSAKPLIIAGSIPPMLVMNGERRRGDVLGLGQGEGMDDAADGGREHVEQRNVVRRGAVRVRPEERPDASERGPRRAARRLVIDAPRSVQVLRGEMEGRRR